MVLIDTGPLAAFFIRRDAHHTWAVAQFKAYPAPFHTCEAVLTEAEHIIDRIAPMNVPDFRAFLESGVIAVSFSLGKELLSVLRLQQRYHDVPMSLADACLVRMQELAPAARIFTTDGDFQIYRKNNRQVIPLIFPHER